MPDTNRDPLNEDEIELDGLELDGLGLDGDDDFGEDQEEPEEPEEPSDPAEPTAPGEEEDDSYLDLLTPGDEPTELVTEQGPSSSSKGRNNNRRAEELAAFQVFFSRPLDLLKQESHALIHEAEEIEKARQKAEREKRRQERRHLQEGTDNFLNASRTDGEYKAPVSNLSSPADLESLKEKIPPIEGLSSFQAAPKTDEDVAEFYHHLGQNTEIKLSQWMRICRGLVGLLPEWREIERQDIIEGRSVFNRIAVSVIPNSQTLPESLDNVTIRKTGKGSFPIGWKRSISIKNVTIMIGENASTLILDKSQSFGATYTGNSEKMPRLVLSIEGGRNALYKQLLAKMPMSSKNDINQAINDRIQSINPENGKKLFADAIGAKAWTESSPEQNVSVDVNILGATPNTSHGNMLIQTITNQNGRETDASTMISTISDCLTVISRSKSNEKNNAILRAASPVKSRLEIENGERNLVLSCNVENDKITVTIPACSDWDIKMGAVQVDVDDIMTLMIAPQQENENNSAILAQETIETANSIISAVRILHDYLENGGSANTRLRAIAVGNQIIQQMEKYGDRMTGMPYTKQELSQTIESFKQEAGLNQEAENDQRNNQNTPNRVLPRPSSGPELGL